jgi:hypothetical protein
MKNIFKKHWQIVLGIFLVLLSMFLYFIHYLIFRDLHHIMIYFLGDIAFIPIEVLIVTLIIHKILSDLEKQAMLKKLNMVVGAFFSEVGNDLLKFLIDFDSDKIKLRDKMNIKLEWNKSNFNEALNCVKTYDVNIVVDPKKLKDIKSFLLSKREFLLRILENPNVLEHESFTNLLLAVFHFTEELDQRKNVEISSGKDLEHLGVDVKRVYKNLLVQWIDYMMYLSAEYPYLYSLGVRTNPYNLSSKAEVE